MSAVDVHGLQEVVSDLRHAAKVDDFEVKQIAFLEAMADRVESVLRQSGEAVATHQMILAGIGTLRKSDGKTPVLHYNEVADLYEAMRKAAPPATSGLVEALLKIAAEQSAGNATEAADRFQAIARAALAAHDARGGA